MTPPPHTVFKKQILVLLNYKMMSDILLFPLYVMKDDQIIVFHVIKIFFLTIQFLKRFLL